MDFWHGCLEVDLDYREASRWQALLVLTEAELPQRCGNWTSTRGKSPVGRRWSAFLRQSPHRSPHSTEDDQS